MSKIHIDEVVHTEAFKPLLINFLHGYTTENFPPTKCNLFTHEESCKTTVVTELGGLVYAGEEKESPLGKTLLLARNKKTGKARVIEVGSASLKPVLDIDNEVSQLLETSHLELSRKFGSKKQKQKMEQREKLKVNIETVTEQMQNVTENVSVDKLDLTVYNKMDSDDFYVPPIDRTAAKPEDVYEASKILTPDQYDNIFSEIEDKDYESEFSPFVKSITSGKKLSKRHTVLAVYANYLLKYAMTKAKETVHKKYITCPISMTLNKVILDNFSVISNGRRSRPMAYRDKAICHVIVFALIINGLKFDLESLCEDTKMTAATATTKIRVTGATVAVAGGKKVAQLKLPLATKSFNRRKSAKF